MSDHHPHLPPSSFPMFAQCPCFRSGEAGEAALSGERQHLLLAARLTGALVPDDRFGCDSVEVEQVEWAWERIEALISSERMVEKRLSLLDEDFEEITFGTLDVVQVVNTAQGDILKIFDYKSGEEHNYLPQMAVYARMAMAAFGKNFCIVHEVYGRKRWIKEYRLSFSDTDFVMNIIARVGDAKKGPNLNEYCAWCEKSGTCAAATEPIMQVATEYEPTEPVARLPLEKVSTWHASQITDPAEMSIVLQVAEHLGKWASAAKAHARQAALDGMQIPGYCLEAGKRTRMVTDLNVVFESSGLTSSEFLSCCDISVPGLEKAMARKNGFKSSGVKAAKDKFDGMLGNFIVYKEGAPVLVRA